MSGRGDTIVAISTATGRGGIGIVRLSGPNAAKIGQEVFQPRKKTQKPWPTHQLLLGEFVDPKNRLVVDEGYAARMQSPHSYTGEEMVELQAHGSPIALQNIISACVSQGARIAQPGEFTQRAFLHGKIDLVQAEAVAEFIDAESEEELRVARRRIEGKVSEQLHLLREETISVLAECEADIDFPEEGLSFSNRPLLLEKFQKIQQLGAKIRDTYEANQRLKSGFVVVLVGRPNVGKSSLFNALLQMDRAIVTEIAGTTRDPLREELYLEGRRVRLVDTAGLRNESSDSIERIGMERSRAEMAKADLLFLICDTTEGITDVEKNLLSKVQKEKVWIVWNKNDLKKEPVQEKQEHATFSVSALKSLGLEALQSALTQETVEKTSLSMEGGISNDRQREKLDAYLVSLSNAEAEWRRNSSPELVAFELRAAHQNLSRLLGKDEGAEDVLSEIFARFCIGK